MIRVPIAWPPRAPFHLFIDTTTFTSLVFEQVKHVRLCGKGIHFDRPPAKPPLTPSGENQYMGMRLSIKSEREEIETQLRRRSSMTFGSKIGWNRAC